LDQRGFLLNLGLRERADRLKGVASQAQAEAVDAAFHRLTASEKRGMGSLFQAIGIADPRLAALSGFASA
jgi:SAM-dependent MidA family methyltransferase